MTPPPILCACVCDGRDGWRGCSSYPPPPKDLILLGVVDRLVLEGLSPGLVVPEGFNFPQQGFFFFLFGGGGGGGGGGGVGKSSIKQYVKLNKFVTIGGQRPTEKPPLERVFF